MTTLLEYTLLSLITLAVASLLAQEILGINLAAWTQVAQALQALPH